MGTLEGRSVNEIDASADGAGENKAAVYDGERDFDEIFGSVEAPSLPTWLVRVHDQKQ